MPTAPLFDGHPRPQFRLLLLAGTATALLGGALLPVGLVLAVQAPTATGSLTWAALGCIATALAASGLCVFALRKVVEHANGPTTDPLVRVATCGHAFAVMLLAGVLGGQLLIRLTATGNDLPDLGWVGKVGLVIGVLVLLAARIRSLSGVYDIPILLFLAVVGGWVCEGFGWGEGGLTAGLFVLIGCVFHLLRLFNYAGGPVAITLAVLAGPGVAGYLLLSSGRPFDFHELYWSCLSAYALVGLVGGAVGFPAFFAARLWQYASCLGPVARVIAGGIWAAVGVAVLYAVFTAGSLFSAVDIPADTPVSAYARFERATSGLAATVSWAAVVAPALAAVSAAVLFVAVWWSGTSRAPLWVPLAVRFARRGSPEKAVPRLIALLDSRDPAARAAASLGGVGQGAVSAIPALESLHGREQSAAETFNGEWDEHRHPRCHAEDAATRIAESMTADPRRVFELLNASDTPAEVQDVLLDALEHSPNVRFDAAQLIPLLGGNSLQLVRFAIPQLGELGPAAAAALPAMFRRLGEVSDTDQLIVAAALAIDPTRQRIAEELAKRASDWHRWRLGYAHLVHHFAAGDPAFLPHFFRHLPADAAGKWVLDELVAGFGDDRSTLFAALRTADDSLFSPDWLQRLITSYDSERQEFAVERLARLGTAGGPALAAHLRNLRRGSEEHTAALRRLARIAPTHPAVAAECFASLAEDARYTDSDTLGGGEALAHLLKHQLLMADSVPRLKDALESHRSLPHLLKAIGSLGSAAASLVPDLLKLKADAGEQRRDEIDAALDQIGPVGGRVRELVIEQFTYALELDEDDFTCQTAQHINRDLGRPPERLCGNCVNCVYVGYLQWFDRSPQDAIPPLVERLLLAAQLPTLKINDYQLRKALARLGVPTDPPIAQAVMQLLDKIAPADEVAFARKLFADPKAYTEEQYEKFLWRLVPDDEDEDDDLDEDDGGWDFEKNNDDLEDDDAN